MTSPFNQTMHCVLLIPDGVGVRNFVFGRFLDGVSTIGRTTILHGIPGEVLPTYSAPFNGAVDWRAFTAYRETPLSAMLRYALAYAQMHWVATESMKFNARGTVHGSWKTKAVHGVAKATGRLAAAPAGIHLLDRLHCSTVGRMASVKEYCRLFERIKPTVLLCTHQRPPVILPPVLAARILGIPTATFIFSWDNLSSKGRIAAPFDHYLVWSRHMRDELLRYYPDVAAERVHVVGTPQFDAYADPTTLWSRQEFFARIGADPDRKLICYSGGDTGNCPEDHHHVRILLELIRSGSIPGNPQVLLRPSPVDDGERYNAVRRDFPELIYRRPDWLHTEVGNWAKVLPQKSDVQFLANVTYYSDLNLNFGSTMTLDFALHDKPVINPVIDVSRPFVHGKPLLDFCMQFEHYRPVKALGAARFAATREQLAHDVTAYLADPSLDREGRRKLVDMQVQQPLGHATEQILSVLTRIQRPAPGANG